jgi:hypothetical protein
VSQDLIAGYEDAIDRLVNLVETFPNEQAVFGAERQDTGLAAALVNADEPWSADEDEIDERAADAEALRAAPGEVRVDIDKSRPRFADSPETQAANDAAVGAPFGVGARPDPDGNIINFYANVPPVKLTDATRSETSSKRARRRRRR